LVLLAGTTTRTDTLKVYYLDRPTASQRVLDCYVTRRQERFPRRLHLSQSQVSNRFSWKFDY
jgi:hypothetical protein